MRKIIVILIFSALFAVSCATDSFGVYHTVKKGENVTKISQLYNVDANELRQENSIPEGVDELKEGSAIFIPGAANVIETSPAETSPETSPNPEPEPESEQETSPETENEIENETEINFIWPAAGKIVKTFSSSAPKSEGIDIEFEKSTEIRAVANGKVVFSSQHDKFGNTVIILHDNNLYTIYAFLSEIVSKEGETLKQNDILGNINVTEKNPKPTLHFEIRKSAKPIDPLKYLPKN